MEDEIEGDLEVEPQTGGEDELESDWDYVSDREYLEHLSRCYIIPSDLQACMLLASKFHR